MADPTADSEAPARTYLAFIVTMTSVVGVLVLAAVIVALPKERSDAADHVLGTVLPVIGTWVGTILAFYFGKANFESAARSVGDLAKQLSPLDKLRIIAAKDKMIPKDQMFLKQEPLDALKVIDVLSDMKSANKGDRLPVIMKDGAPKFIIHDSMLNEYLAAEAKASAQTDVNTLTFADLFAKRPDLVTLFSTSFAVVPSGASLADAKTAMDQTKNCEDVFLTATGARSEAIIGWITDNIIQANLQSK